MPNVITSRVSRVLEPAANPTNPNGLVVTHSVTIREWRNSGLVETPRWRLRVALLSNTIESGEPWTYKPIHLIEEHDPSVGTGALSWVIRYSYRSHDEALAQLEALAEREPGLT